jgi:hypothetical protein
MKMSRIALLAAIAAFCVLPLRAQMHAGGGFVGRPAGSAFSGHGVFAHGFRGGQRGFGRTGVIYPFYPGYYDDYGDYAPQVGPAPQVVVMQPAAAPQQPAPPSPPAEPVLIEWQGNRFVRMTIAEKNAGAPVDYAETGKSNLAIATAMPARDLPPAVLVFRDGHQQEVSSYTIMNGTIFTRSDYWTTGMWNQKIQIADLDVPATLRQNQARGLSFNLPSSANEVIVRP